jgi:hypothetical protein
MWTAYAEVAIGLTLGNYLYEIATSKHRWWEAFLSSCDMAFAIAVTYFFARTP